VEAGLKIRIEFSVPFLPNPVPGGWSGHEAVSQALPVLVAFALALGLVQALGVVRQGAK